MSNNMLLNTYRKTGSDMESLRKANEKMSGITKELVIKPYDIQFLSYCGVPKLQKEGRTTFYKLEKMVLDGFLKGEPLATGTVPNEKLGSDELIGEMINSTELGLLIKIEDKVEFFYVSSIALPTFTLRAGVKGDMTISVNNLIRNMHIADALYRRNEPIHLVYREMEVDGVTVRKVFAGLGNAYVLVPQTIIVETIDKLAEDGIVGSPVLESFELDHEFTSASVLLPEIGEEVKEEFKLKDSITPGVYLQTSDVGKSSVIVRGFYQHGRSKVITDDVELKHMGSITAQTVLAEADKKIFASIRKLPETLCDLIGREVADYSKLDLTSKKDKEKNVEMVYEIIETELNRVCKEAKVSVKKNAELFEALRAEINPELHYTLYDIAMIFMGMPERITGLDSDTITRLQKACGQSPYKLSKLKSFSEEEEITLLPS